MSGDGSVTAITHVTAVRNAIFRTQQVKNHSAKSSELRHE